MNKIITFLFVVFTAHTLSSQSLTIERAEEFLVALLNDDDSLETFVLPEELALSKRLGINYEGIKNKFLLSYEIPQKIIKQINKGLIHTYNIEKINDGYEILHFQFMDYETKYYFKKGFLISPPCFYYKDWQKIESENFIFYVSEPKYFNQYSINRLENFAKHIFSVLKFTDEEKEIIQKEKLIYILCKDDNEIEKLTGYKARGMGNLAYDYVITTYNCHYHELLHILMNFKLKKLPLYTHPFLQEGFAVAYGGRGGYEPGIVLNLGKFLEQSEFLKFNQILSADEYKTYDVSMSYPLSGLYNLFLIHEIGIYDYLRLYLKYSADNINPFIIDSTELPSRVQWRGFIDNFSNEEEIKIDFSEENFKMLFEDSNFTIKENEEFYLFETKGNLLISVREKPGNYISKIFNDYYPDENYNNEKYLVRVNDVEVAVYNLFTNNLIANYVSGFSQETKSVLKKNDHFKFLINKNIFEEEPDKFNIIETED